MKMTDINVYVVCVSDDCHKNWVFIQVLTDEGISGVGEASNWPGSTSIEGGVKELRKILIGRDPMDIERLWALMYNRTSPHGLAGVISAISGIDQALWDIRGKAQTYSSRDTPN